MSWEKVKLGDIVKLITGKTPPTSNLDYFDGGYLWINPSDFGNKYITETKRSLSQKAVDEKKCNLLPEGTVLLSCIGDIGKVGILKERGTTNQQITGLITNDNLFPDYLYYYLLTNKSKLESLANKAVVAILNNERLRDLEIPLPPLPIQQRIAEILDAADALRRKDEELLRKYDELAQAIFIDMFGDPVKNEKGFAKIKLGECLENIQIGPFGTQLHESDYIKNGIPLINPMHIGDLKIRPNNNYSISEEKYVALPQYQLKIDDVILGRRGEMGRCAIVTEELGKCLCGTGSLFLTVNKELLDPLFLVYVLSRKTTKIALENVSAGTTMANLNKNIISDFEIILPEIKKQKDFVSAIKMSEKSIEFTNELIIKSDQIFNSLLQQAFKGELVK